MPLEGMAFPPTPSGQSPLPEPWLLSRLLVCWDTVHGWNCPKFTGTLPTVTLLETCPLGTRTSKPHSRRCEDGTLTFQNGVSLDDEKWDHLHAHWCPSAWIPPRTWCWCREHRTSGGAGPHSQNGISTPRLGKCELAFSQAGHCWVVWHAGGPVGPRSGALC